MMLRFTTSFAAAAAIVFLGISSFGAAIAPPAPQHLKVIATVVAHAHGSDWVAVSGQGL